MFRLHKWGSSSCPVPAYLSNLIPSLYDSLNNSKWDVKIDRNFRGCSSQHCNLIDDTPFQVAWVVSAFRDYGFLAWHDKRWKKSRGSYGHGFTRLDDVFIMLNKYIMSLYWNYYTDLFVSFMRFQRSYFVSNGSILSELFTIYYPSETEARPTIKIIRFWKKKRAHA